MSPSADANKKLWTWQSSLVDHVRIMLKIPMMLISPIVLSAAEMEAVQSAVSSVNSCNLSATYRRETSRMVGMDVSGLEEWIGYGRSFGLKDGTGRQFETLHQEIASTSGSFKVAAAQSVASFQLWMDLTGNTILGFLRGTLTCQRRSEQNVLFELLFFAYYIIPYILLVVSAIIFKIIPARPRGLARFIYKIIHIIQVVVATVFIIPFAIIGVATLPFYIVTGRDATPLPSRNSYIEIPSVDVENNGVVSNENDDRGIATDGSVSVFTEGEFFTVKLVKPTPESKVGIRFGSNRTGHIMVTNMRKGSIAAEAAAPGLKIGDLVESINGLSMDSKSPKFAAATLLGAEGTITLLVSRGGGTIMNEEATV